MTEISSVALVLQPQRKATLPAWLGRAAQASFLKHLQHVNPDLSKTIHDAPSAKPFTSSSLIGARKSGEMLELSPDATLRLRYTTLHPQLTTIFHDGILPQWEDQTLTLHGQVLDVVAIEANDATPWVEQADYVDLVDNASTQNSLTLTFTSPTAFKRTEGGYNPLPQPELVFSSLLSRWNAFAPFRLPEWVYDTIHDDILIEHTHIQTEAIAFARGQRGTITGFIGKVTYRVQGNADARRYIQALGHFAKFSGVGIKTTVGMGQAKIA